MLGSPFVSSTALTIRGLRPCFYTSGKPRAKGFPSSWPKESWPDSSHWCPMTQSKQPTSHSLQDAARGGRCGALPSPGARFHYCNGKSKVHKVEMSTANVRQDLG